MDGDAIQGNVLAGFNKPHQRFAMVQLPPHVEDARAWLAEMVPLITCHAPVAKHNKDEAWKNGEYGTWTALGLTRSGLERLGVEDLNRALADHWAFAQGAEARADDMGDVDESRPAGWIFGSGFNVVDAVVTVAGDDTDHVAGRLETVTQIAADHAAQIPHVQEAARLDGGHEHFGFKDGGFQPRVEGVDGDGDRRLTEFVLGPETDPWWLRDASFQVLRLLAQDVAGWREAAVGQDERIGRTRDGKPLDPIPPFSHLGKTRPPHQYGPEKRRLIRRGIPYGPPYDDDPEAERGLVFNAFMASIDRQYEYIQRLWANKADFPAPGTGWDPVIGGPDRDLARYHEARGETPQPPARHVWTRGAVYAVALGLPVLRELAGVEALVSAS